MDSKTPNFPFAPQNYRVLLIGIGVLIIGYLLMAGGGSEDPSEFSYDIFSARRITVAPIVVLLGYAIILYGIVLKPKETAEHGDQ